MNASPGEHRQSLKSPGADRGILVAPGWSDIRRGLCAAPPRGIVLGEELAMVRARLRQRLGLGEPVIVTGHQAEFYHAGVFAKAIVAALLAESDGATYAFVTVDSDTPKTLQLSIPRTDDDDVLRESLPIPALRAHLPMELQGRAPAAAWRGFFDRAAALRSADDCSVLREFAAALDRQAATVIDPVRLACDGRAAVERLLGLTPGLDLAASSLCQTPEFQRFLALAIADADAFAESYNGALGAFQIRYAIRNVQRPVPPLRRGVDRIELPFWVYDQEGRRRRLGVSAAWPRAVFAGDELIGTFDRAALLARAADPSAAALFAAEWRVRARALALSAFMRLFIADVFIHGIGGAQYDEITEDFVRRACGIELPPLAIVSATLLLPVAGAEAPRESVPDGALRRELRYNPQRLFDHLPAELVEQRAALVTRSDTLRQQRDASPTGRAARREVWTAIRETNGLLRQAAGARADALVADLARIEAEQRRSAVLRDRNYFFALHPRAALDDLVRRFRGAARAV